MCAAARLLSLTLKAGEGTTLPTRSPTTQRILLGRTGAGVHVLKVGVRLQNLTHDQGVLLPVSRQTPYTAGLEHARNLISERRGHQAALVVAGLVPGIREEHPQLVHGVLLKHVVEQFGCVRLSHTHVLHAGVAHLQQQIRDAGGVHLNGEEVRLGHLSRAVHNRLAQTGTDLDDLVRLTAVNLNRVEGRLGGHGGVGAQARNVQHVGGGVGVPRLLAARGEAVAAADEGVGLAEEFLGNRLLGLFFGGFGCLARLRVLSRHT